MHVLLTGATGFIGSALAARFLDLDARVTCLARGGAEAETRLQRAVSEAAEGFGFDVDPARIRVLPYDVAGVEREHAGTLADLDAVWHCAAHMTFSRRRLREALDFNVGGTRALYEMVGRVASGRPRFYYASTAYTGGVEAEAIGEELHLSPHLVNPYFVSKWGAELVLARLAEQPGALPVTLYRPTIVVGHAETGWYGGQSFGLYNFLDGVWAGHLAGARALRLDIAPEVQHNYLPIDDLVYNATALTALDGTRHPVEVLNEAGTDNPNADRVAWIAEGLDLELELGRPRSVADHVVDAWIAVNKPFNRSEVGEVPFPFQSGRIPSLLGERTRHHPLDRATHLRLIRWYRSERQAETARRAARSGAVRAARLATRTGVQSVIPKRVMGGLVAKAVARAQGLL